RPSGSRGATCASPSRPGCSRPWLGFSRRSCEPQTCSGPSAGALATTWRMQQLACGAAEQPGWHEVPAPTLQGPGEALVRPLAVARCDIDVPLASGGFPLSGPFAVGHECVGEIVALGEAVRGLAVGQRVVVSFQLSCGTCPQCA